MTLSDFKVAIKKRVVLNALSTPGLECSTQAEQDDILKTLIEISKTNQYYSMCVLKKLISFLETSEVEINEDYYEYLMEWLNSQPLKPTDTDIIIYTLTHNFEIRIRESPNIISGLGTTGLRTWEASIFLAQYFCVNKILTGDLLELGCGTGLVSASLLKDQHVKNYGKMFVTDGDSQLLKTVKENLILNGINHDENNFEIRRLFWGEDELPSSVQTIVAADVTYDSSIIPNLLRVVREGFNQNVKDVYLAATRRNEDTLAVWEQGLNDGEAAHLWSWTVASSTKEGDNVLLYGAHTPRIDIYHLQKIQS